MDWMRDHLWATWLGLAGVLVVIELLSLELVLLMVALGAVVGGIAALVGLPFVAQVILAVVAAGGALAFARPSMVRRLRQGPELTHGHQRLIGQQGVVLREASVQAPGLVNLSGDQWTCVPYDDTEVILPGSTVEVWEIRGATAVVHPIAAPPTLEDPQSS